MEPYWWSESGPSEVEPACDDGKPLCVAFDFGIKYNILRRLRAEGFRVRVVPARTPAREVLALKPDGGLPSNGPGGPGPLDLPIPAPPHTS